MNIDKNEALRYMGYRGQNLDAAMQSLLSECISELRELSRESHTYGIYELERIGSGLSLKNTTLVLEGEAIAKHLNKAEKCAVMAVTLGIDVDRRIALYGKTDLTRGVVLDACAAAAVEALCDEVQERIRAEAEAMGLAVTTRFSPGYGDFSIDIQREIARVLGTYEKIGLSVNESSLMLPRKSVTAFIGLQRESCESLEGHKCSSCEDRNCRFRKDGVNCE